jgi:hypothetical protein
MASLDRTALIELLDRLGSDDDATVLEAARALHRMAADAGLSWDDIIQLDRDDDASPEASDDIGPMSRASPDAADTMRVIDRLLRKGVSETLREDLLEMKRQLGEGSLDEGDRRYVLAVAKRLGV